ncbi:MAG: hypothetical protein ACN4GM_06095 [Gammaproteobacteria bacterium]
MDITAEFFQSEVEKKDKKQRQQQLSSDHPSYKLCCAICGRKITDHQQQAEIEGSHTHSKLNPDQQSFIIRCFVSVENCKVSGEKTALNSWFTGCQWQFVHCNHCSTQLGWYFSGVSSFYGLIEQQLVICDE